MASMKDKQLRTFELEQAIADWKKSLRGLKAAQDGDNGKKLLADIIEPLRREFFVKTELAQRLCPHSHQGSLLDHP